MTQPRPPIRVRGRSFMATVLAPTPPLEDWLADLDGLSRRAPAFFAGRPVLLDLSALRPDRAGAEALVAELHGRGITVVALEGEGAEGFGAGLPPALSGGRPGAEIETAETTPEPPRAAAPARSLVLDQPVRSGQAVVHLDGDVTVLGSVASGAEVVAGGSVHVYGALRGRAVAGAAGDPEARITCRRFEPELIAIDGLYRTADDLDGTRRGQAVQVRLVDDALRIAPLDG